MIKTLNSLIRGGKFKLVLPKQIEDEFLRNKYGSSVIFKDHISNFEKGLSVSFKAPNLIKSSRLVGQIKGVVKKLNELKTKAVKDYERRVFSPSSEINRQLKKLFDGAIRPVESDTLLQRAWFRTLRGNPPRKDNSSFGDSIIWETILEHCVDQDLVLVSGDSDFESEIHGGSFHEFLKEEWVKASGGKDVGFYTELGTFINFQSKKAKKPIKEETIQEEKGLLGAVSQARSSMDVSSIVSSIKDTYLPLTNNAINRHLVSTGGYGLATHGGVVGAKCSCCGAELDDIGLGYSVFGSRCENCYGHFDSGKTCNKCGRHFHRDEISFTSIGVFSSDGRCGYCKLKA
jgi:hypothetical protein